MNDIFRFIRPMRRFGSPAARGLEDYCFPECEHRVP
jgi:hypothetical protein